MVAAAAFAALAAGAALQPQLRLTSRSRVNLRAAERGPPEAAFPFDPSLPDGPSALAAMCMPAPPTAAADAASTAAQSAAAATAAATAAAAAAVAVPAPASAATAMLLARSDGSFLGELTENWDPTDAYYALIGVAAVAYGAYTVFSESIEKAKAADARQQREGRTRGNSDKGSSMEDLAKFLRDQE